MLEDFNVVFEGLIWKVGFEDCFNFVVGVVSLDYFFDEFFFGWSFLDDFFVDEFCCVIFVVDVEWFENYFVWIFVFVGFDVG